jgi:maltooligosyltrehalose trehalohydrolase
MPDGRVRFGLWAPDRNGVDLVLVDRDRIEPMTSARDGWFELVTDAAGPGSAYLYRLDNGLRVPDPASRAQRGDVHGPSLVVDPDGYRRQDPDWRGRPWEEAVVCELHVGTATPEATFDGLRRRLDHFVEIGITAIELMPLAQFSGERGWGYDGVLLYAPHRTYGSPEDLKRLIDEAHGHGLMVFLDVVYNHFGPDGNYLGAYASSFFQADSHTPWGPRIAFERPEVRTFFIQNALYWLTEVGFDGLRLDAVNQIADPSAEHILSDLARRVRTATQGRHVHLVLENDNNEAFRLERDGDGRTHRYTAQWNDDNHHAMHVVLTGETDGYYRDFADDPTARLARGLAEGFIYQGEASAYRKGRRRGSPGGALPSVAFVDFIQNHDQVGNRAFGERLTTLVAPEAVDAALAVLLLSPHVPLLFMGEEWGEDNPFLFFCDFEGELAEAVRTGRRREFARFAGFGSERALEAIPDPNDPGTFAASRIDWTKPAREPYRARRELVRRLLAVRRAEIVPRLGAAAPDGRVHHARDGLLAVSWRLADGSRLRLDANLASGSAAAGETLPGRCLWRRPERDPARAVRPPWSVAWTLVDAPR